MDKTRPDVKEVVAGIADDRAEVDDGSDGRASQAFDRRGHAQTDLQHK